MGGVRITEACRKGLRFPQLHFRIGIQILSDSTEVGFFFGILVSAIPFIQYMIGLSICTCRLHVQIVLFSCF